MGQNRKSQALTKDRFLSTVAEKLQPRLSLSSTMAEVWAVVQMTFRGTQNEG
jgi:hypothetical protein